ncbi:AAA family ATPase [Bacillus shihchuchen]|uniref:AAA family ATPase n=1 Tax=Bacillus shihchuchen TaxID=3036942 RepID=A0ABT7L066_9BACI|nr:AAA family ATPase [Bacillus shihchuchen]
MLKIKSIDIEGIGIFDKLSLNFNEGFNLICGPNGIGKTTILESIGQSFSGPYATNLLRRNFKHPAGKVKLNLLNGDMEFTAEMDRSTFHPDEAVESAAYALNEFSKQVVVFKTYRGFDYIKVESIGRDQNKEDNRNECANGVDSIASKQWFINRFMWAGRPGTLSKEEEYNLMIAQSIFELIDENIKFHDVKHDTFDILVKQKDESVIYFEYLSSGYKSVIYILLGLIKELELRFKNPKMQVDDFEGVILIDELDLHLHPQWQAKLVGILKKIFKKPNLLLVHIVHI